VARAVETLLIALSSDASVTVPPKLNSVESTSNVEAPPNRLRAENGDRLAVVRADLEGDRAAAVQQRDAVELRLRRDPRDFVAQLRNLAGDRGLVRRRQRPVVVLDGQVANALQHRLHLVHRAFRRLHQRDRVLRVPLSLGETADLGLQLLADREAGGVVGRAVDAIAGAEALHRLRQLVRRADEVAVRTHRSDVRLNAQGHALPP